MKTRRILLIVLAAVLVLAAIAGGGWGLLRTSAGPRVAAYTPVRQPLTQTLLLFGRFAEPARVELGAMVQSTVVEVKVEEGDRVEAGQLLVRLADEEAAARVAEAEASVAEAEARLGRVRGVGRQVASEQLNQATLDAEQAERDFDRLARLHEDGALTEADFEAARQRRDAARSRRVAARLEVAATNQTGADTAAAAAALRRSQAGLEGARAALDRSRIRAPTDGIVLQRLVEPGQVVRPGDTLLRLSGAGELQAVITPDETHLGRLEVGQPARIRAEAFPNQVLSATVRRIAPQVDASRGTVEVRLDLDPVPDSLELRSDMTATVEVILGESEDALVLPTTLIRDLGTPRPWVLVAQDGVATRQDVSLGLEGTDAVEISDGLSEQALVLPPEAAVDPGEPVRTRRPRPALDAPEG